MTRAAAQTHTIAEGDADFVKLLKAAGKATGVRNPKKLYLVSSGAEVNEMEDIRSGDVLAVSGGEPMYAAAARTGAPAAAVCVCVGGGAGGPAGGRAGLLLCVSPR